VPLTVCATPIGNLEDVTLRVLAALGAADLVLCEDTRRTRILLERHGITARLVSYHAHNEARRAAEVLPLLEAGQTVALVSDAGLPGINDPGMRLVAAARDAGLPVTVLPGPSAVETALVASGFESEQYQFLGYLPRGARALAALWDVLASWPHAAVAFESPQRLPAALRSLAAAMPDRQVAIGGEPGLEVDRPAPKPPVRQVALAGRFARGFVGKIDNIRRPRYALGRLLSISRTRRRRTCVVSF